MAALPGLCLLVGGVFPDTNVSAFFLPPGAAPSFQLSSTAFGPAPSYLALSRDRSVAYSANHGTATPGVTVTSLAWSPSSGCLAGASQLQFVPGPDPCHVAVHPSGRFLFSASYAQGSVSVHTIGPGGLLSPPATLQLGANARAMVYFLPLAQGGKALAAVELEVMSQEVVIGLLAVSLSA